jgi:hypothetical protein
MTQNNLGLALRGLGERQGGAEGTRRLTEAVEAYRRALTVFTRDALPQPWAQTQNNLGRALQVQIGRYGFAKGLELVDRLSQAEGIRDDPVAQASLQTLAVVCQIATDQRDKARGTFQSLVALVERQPDDFHLVWNWARLRKLVAESMEASVAGAVAGFSASLSTHREGLQKLIDAVAKENKAAILAGLKEVQDQLLSRGNEPVKQPRQ